MSPQLADEAEAAPASLSPVSDRPLIRRAAGPGLAVAGLIILGLAVRYAVAGQSLFADELSTYWISATHSLDGVLSLMYGSGRVAHAEITPPLYFVAAWATTQFGHSAEWLRAPSLVAGVATIPLVYLLGTRTIGRSAALLAATVTALSPFMIYYSGEARSYALMMALVVGSTLAMLTAVDDERTRWWVAYSGCSALAFFTHYTCAFVLGAQFLWLLWAHPSARRPALIANVVAAAALLPWLPGLINDFSSPTLKILAGLSPFTPHDIRLDLEHWALGYPYVTAGSLRDLPGVPSLVMLAAAALVTAGGVAARLAGGSLRRRPVDKRVLLVIIAALAVPVGEGLISAAGNHIFGVRNLAASWPYLALSGAAVVMAAGARTRLVAAGLAVVAFALAAGKMLSPRFQRPDNQAATSFVLGDGRAGDVVVDETGAPSWASGGVLFLSPGPLTGFDVSWHGHLPVIRAAAPAERDHPFGFADPAVPLAQALRAAVARAYGGRVFFVTNARQAGASRLIAIADPGARYRLVIRRRYEGIRPTFVEVYAAASPKP